jgi:hypothetical protein
MTYVRRLSIWVIAVGSICLVSTASLFAIPLAKDGQGTMTVSPNTVNAGSTNTYLFTFQSTKQYSAGSQATLQIPAGWSAPQTSNVSGVGYVTVAPVLGSSTVTIAGISGSGPWTLNIPFSTSQNHAGFTVNYNRAVMPTNGGVYTLVTSTKQSGGNLRVLRGGSPTVTAGVVTKTNTAVTLSSGLNPSTYGVSVTFTAVVTWSGGSSTPSGTVTFKEGDVVLGTVALNASAQATFSTNRFVVQDSPCSITAEYNGDIKFNASVSAVLLQIVNAATVNASGLAALNKTYDATTTATLDVSSVSLSGALAGDNVALDPSVATATFSDPNAGASKSVAVSGLALLGTDSGNYVLGVVNAVTASIFPAPLTVTANNTNRFFGDVNPAFTASYSGFVAGENASVLSGAPAFNTSATQTSPVGGSPYTINVSTGTLAASNYGFGFNQGQLTIVPKPAQPQRIVSLTKLPDSTISVNCSGDAGRTYLLQACPDYTLVSWTTIATNSTDVNGFMTCVDGSATNLSSRFYRTALP